MAGKQNTMSMIGSHLNRRRFLQKTALAMAGVSVVPSALLGLRGQTPPSRKLNIACIGVGGRGRANLSELDGENIVALCDVDSKRAEAAFAKHPKARTFQDFRKMFDAMSQEIDAVVVSTPDHTHAVAALPAMQLGKHVYCEKPLAHSVDEVRALMAAAHRFKVVTQLGNQGHSFGSIRDFCETIWDGAIGTVREIHAVCGSDYGHRDLIEEVRQGQPVPETLNWDLWLGPAPFRPYHSAYVPGRWRGWRAFGTGVLGDWTCHVIDPVYWALNLDAPTSVVAETGDYDPKKHSDTFPSASVIRYEFPARGARPAVKIIWYDGLQRPTRPEELPPGKELPRIGALVVGDQGKIMYGSHGAAGFRLLPASRMAAYQKPAPSLVRSPGHQAEWVKACKEGTPTGSHFDYGGPLTEIALLGAIAMLFKDQRLEWDSRAMRFTNCPEANRYLHSAYRSGWKLA